MEALPCRVSLRARQGVGYRVVLAFDPVCLYCERKEFVSFEEKKEIEFSEETNGGVARAGSMADPTKGGGVVSECM